MRVVPWRQVAYWRCKTCGNCCKNYNVVLNFYEWLCTIKRFGVEYTSSSINRFFLNKRTDGSCIFLQETPNISLCNLQYMKPLACRLWPFKILSKPKYGFHDQAIYHYDNQKLFVYADSACSGLTFGAPTREFTHYVLREFIEIVYGRRRRQFKSTGLLRQVSPVLALSSRFSPS